MKEANFISIANPLHYSDLSVSLTFAFTYYDIASFPYQQ